MQPTTLIDRLCCRFGPVVITKHYAIPTGTDLAHLTDGQYRVGLGITDRCLCLRQRLSGTKRDIIRCAIRPILTNDRRLLGLPERSLKLAVHRRPDSANQLWSYRRSTGDNQLHGIHVA